MNRDKGCMSIQSVVQHTHAPAHIYATVSQTMRRNPPSRGGVLTKFSRIIQNITVTTSGFSKSISFNVVVGSYRKCICSPQNIFKQFV